MPWTWKDPSVAPQEVIMTSATDESDDCVIVHEAKIKRKHGDKTEIIECV